VAQVARPMNSRRFMCPRRFQSRASYSGEPRDQSLSFFDHHVVQDRSICARFGSMSALNACSHPRSARSEIGFPVGQESCRLGSGGAIGCRSALAARLTEMVTAAAFSAVTGLANMQMTPAVRALKRQAAEMPLYIGCLRFARPIKNWPSNSSKSSWTEVHWTEVQPLSFRHAAPRQRQHYLMN